jgi:prepilin-type N-terminal cleavage/methylation domain-containing protein
MKEKRLNSQKGVSVVEVLIVVTVVGILSTLALMQISSSKTNFQRQRIAREFKIYLERARFDSVKRRATTVNGVDDRSRLILNSASSFTAIIDKDQNGTILNADGTIQSGDQQVIDFAQRSDTKIFISDTFNYPVTISFNQRGNITAKDNLGNDVNPLFKICSTNCSGTPENNADLTIISLSPTGTVAVLKDTMTPSTLPTPVITSPSPIQFNCYVLIIPNSSTSGCRYD